MCVECKFKGDELFQWGSNISEIFVLGVQKSPQNWNKLRGVLIFWYIWTRENKNGGPFFAWQVLMLEAS